MGAGIPVSKLAVAGTVVDVVPHPCQVVECRAYNALAATGFLVLFDSRASDVTLGTTTPKAWLAVSGDDVDKLGGNVRFGTALSAAGVSSITGAVAHSLDALFIVT